MLLREVPYNIPITTANIAKSIKNIIIAPQAIILFLSVQEFPFLRFCAGFVMSGYVKGFFY
jgi:hypothetical protein